MPSAVFAFLITTGPSQLTDHTENTAELNLCCCTVTCLHKKDKQINKQIDKQTNKQIDKQTNNQTKKKNTKQLKERRQSNKNKANVSVAMKYEANVSDSRQILARLLNFLI